MSNKSFYDETRDNFAKIVSDAYTDGYSARLLYEQVNDMVAPDGRGAPLKGQSGPGNSPSKQDTDITNIITVHGKSPSLGLWQPNAVAAPNNVTVPRAQFDAVEKLYIEAFETLKRERTIYESRIIELKNEASKYKLAIQRINGISRDHANGTD